MGAGGADPRIGTRQGGCNLFSVIARPEGPKQSRTTRDCSSSPSTIRWIVAMTRGVAGLVQFFCSGRRSSVVEQLTRNEQVIGSSPIAGSRYGWEAPQGASILIPP